MKMLSIVAAAAGVIALLLAVIVVLAHSYILGVTGAGYLRGATALFLLALVIMGYDRCYCQKK